MARPGGDWITYEWDVEKFDHTDTSEDQEIFDHNFGKALDEWIAETVVNVVAGRVPGERLVLVRDDGRPGGTKGWAYVEGGKLPDRFDDGERVPKYFHVELQRTLSGGLKR